MDINFNVMSQGIKKVDEKIGSGVKIYYKVYIYMSTYNVYQFTLFTPGFLTIILLSDY